MEQDKNKVLETYAQMAPEVLDALKPEERHRFYKMLRLRVVAFPGGSLEINGAFGENGSVCQTEPTR